MKEKNVKKLRENGRKIKKKRTVIIAIYLYVYFSLIMNVFSAS